MNDTHRFVCYDSLTRLNVWVRICDGRRQWWPLHVNPNSLVTP